MENGMGALEKQEEAAPGWKSWKRHFRTILLHIQVLAGNVVVDDLILHGWEGETLPWKHQDRHWDGTGIRVRIGIGIGIWTGIVTGLGSGWDHDWD